MAASVCPGSLPQEGQSQASQRWFTQPASHTQAEHPGGALTASRRHHRLSAGRQLAAARPPGPRDSKAHSWDAAQSLMARRRCLDTGCPQCCSLCCLSPRTAPAGLYTVIPRQSWEQSPKSTQQTFKTPVCGNVSHSKDHIKGTDFVWGLRCTKF